MCVVSGGAVAFYTAAHAQRREQSRRRRRRWRRRRHLRLRLRRCGQRQRHCNGIRSSQLFARYVAEPLSFTLSGLFPPMLASTYLFCMQAATPTALPLAASTPTSIVLWPKPFVN